MTVEIKVGEEKQMDLKSLQKLVHESHAVILDIEGTITALDFVRKILFPYADKHLDEYILTHWKDEGVQEAFSYLHKQAILDENENLPGFIPISNALPTDEIFSADTEKYLKSVIANVRWQMENDRKTTGLKKIQGLIWQRGYEAKLISGHLYEDVIGALETWKSEGKDIFIYSSGSREAQLNLFQYSTFGNVTKYFREFFDTTIGSKLESSSYKHICDYAGKKPHEVVFFTDRPKEIFAAKECGLKTILVVRDPDNPFIKEEGSLLGHEDGKITSLKDII